MSHEAMTDVLVISFFFSSESISIPLQTDSCNDTKPVAVSVVAVSVMVVSVVARDQIASKNSLKSYIVVNLCYCKVVDLG